MTASEQTTATTEGPAWSAGASGRAAYWAGFAAPAREAVAPGDGNRGWRLGARHRMWKRRVLRARGRPRRPGERHPGDESLKEAVWCQHARGELVGARVEPAQQGEDAEAGIARQAVPQVVAVL